MRAPGPRSKSSRSEARIESHGPGLTEPSRADETRVGLSRADGRPHPARARADASKRTSGCSSRWAGCSASSSDWPRPSPSGRDRLITPPHTFLLASLIVPEAEVPIECLRRASAESAVVPVLQVVVAAHISHICHICVAHMLYTEYCIAYI